MNKSVKDTLLSNLGVSHAQDLIGTLLRISLKNGGEIAVKVDEFEYVPGGEGLENEERLSMWAHNRALFCCITHTINPTTEDFGSLRVSIEGEDVLSMIKEISVGNYVVIFKSPATA